MEVQRHRAEVRAPSRQAAPALAWAALIQRSVVPLYWRAITVLLVLLQLGNLYLRKGFFSV